MAIPPRLPKTNGVLKPLRVYSDEGERRRCEHHEADVVIVGAGIAGCALAVTLGKQGRSVLLLERWLKEPDRIVGELLQPGGVRALEQLGLKDCLEDIDAIECHGMDVIYHGNEVPIQYPRDEQGMPFRGRSFHHGRFIMRLREAARGTPNVTIVETTAVSVIHSSTDNEVMGVQCTTNGQKDYFFAPLTFIADGYASKFRKQYLPTAPQVKSKFWGLELIDAELPRKNFGHVVLPDGPPILLYQIGTRETRILVDIPENLPSASVQNGGIKGHLRNVVLPSLPKCVQPSFAKALEKGALRSMPNSFLPPTTNKTPGLVFLGDSLNMRHPLTGGGMTVAFNDVVVLRNLLSPENIPDFSNKQQVLKQMSKFHWERKGLTSVINILAQALYSLYAANDPYLKILQQGCFRYFQLGLVDGPIGLLAGVIPRPWVLLRHFYSVAFLSIWEFSRSQPAYMFPITFFRCFIVFWTACRVIFPYIFAEIRS
ncbi:squalene monooxygenase [[Emmonsia] crescens]|uniref:Squalene monooxygenase n=1 Tax=[Emmonsia] crescens TaxID=73230 RepID=A0A0G2I9D9_9EURO|nr:squalene monooxygenase [Emmonsia crescens UAMH 3008]